MNDNTGLERRYRRLLAWYPAQHRSAHGDEMIGVLLASAQDGQRRPRRSDALDLALGGMRIRIRAILAGQFDPSFTDALAVYSIAVPVMWLIFICTWAAVTDYHWLSQATATPLWQQLAVQVAFPALLVALTALPILLVWRGRRLAAVLLALVPAALCTAAALMPSIRSQSTFSAADSLLLIQQAAALAVSPGPRRGVELLSKPAWLVASLAGVATAGLVVISEGLLGHEPASARNVTTVCVALLAAAGLLATIRRCIARRLLVLLAAPAYLAGLSIVFSVPGTMKALFSYSTATVYLPALALSVLMAIAALLGRRRQLRSTG